MNTLQFDLAHQLSFWAKSAFVDSAVLHAALDLGVLDVVPVEGDGWIAVAALADRLDAPERGARMIAEVLVGGEVLVAHRDEAAAHRDEAAVRGGGMAVRSDVAHVLRDDRLRALLADDASSWDAAGRLSTAVRDGVRDHRGRDVLADCAERMAPGSGPADGAGARLHDRAGRNHLRSATLIAAAELGVLARLSTGAVSVGELAAACDVPPGRVQTLLGMLGDMGVCAEGPAGHALTEVAQPLLQERSRTSYEHALRITALQWHALGSLSTAIRAGHPCDLDLRTPEHSGRFYAALARYNITIFPTYLRVTRAVATALAPLLAPGERVVLDVGAGSGVWGAAFALDHAGTTTTYLEQPDVLALTRRVVTRLGLDDRARMWAGDLRDVEYGRDMFDVITLGMICHTQPPHELPVLMDRLAAALRPGGVLVIAGPTLYPDRTGPFDALLFAAKEFVTTHGDVLSRIQYGRLLDGAGLPVHRTYELPGIDVILAGADGTCLPEGVDTAARERVGA